MIYANTNTDAFGYLPQLATFYGEACVPTSTTNALTYLVNLPGSTISDFAPLADYSAWASTRDEIGQNYYHTGTSGTLPAFAIEGISDYLTYYEIRNLVSISAIGSSKLDGKNIAGWGLPASDTPGDTYPAAPLAAAYSGIFTETPVSGEYLRASILRNEAIVVGGFYTSGDVGQGHGIVIVGLDWTDINGNGRIDKSENATITILDPLDPAQEYSVEFGTQLSSSGSNSDFTNGIPNFPDAVDALDAVTGTIGPTFKTGTIYEEGNGFLVFNYGQYSLGIANGLLVQSAGDSSNSDVPLDTDMQLMLAMAFGVSGLPDSIDTIISEGMPTGTFVFDGNVFGDHTLEGKLYTTEESDYQNNLMFYIIESDNGAIYDSTSGNSLLPGDANYSELAIKSAVDSNIFNLDKLVSMNAEQLSDFSISFKDDNTVMIAPIVKTSGGDYWFAYEDANTDGFQHFRELAPNTFGVEDQSGGGDLDFNDLVVQLIGTSTVTINPFL